jgi:hypothetical protein
MENNTTPIGTPSERLVVIVLRSPDVITTGPGFGGLTPLELLNRIGGSYRALDTSLMSLFKRGIVERTKDETLGYIYRLNEKYVSLTQEQRRLRRRSWENAATFADMGGQLVERWSNGQPTTAIPGYVFDNDAEVEAANE